MKGKGGERDGRREREEGGNKGTKEGREGEVKIADREEIGERKEMREN